VTGHTLTREDLVSTVARVAGTSHEDIDDSTDLTTLGLDSLSLMRLVNELRVQGLPVSFQDMVGKATFGEWWATISQLLRANPYLAA
jgi:aryl carrier-like protein